MSGQLAHWIFGTNQQAAQASGQIRLQSEHTFKGEAELIFIF